MKASSPGSVKREEQGPTDPTWSAATGRHAKYKSTKVQSTAHSTLQHKRSTTEKQTYRNPTPQTNETQVTHTLRNQLWKPNLTYPPPLQRLPPSRQSNLIQPPEASPI